MKFINFLLIIFITINSPVKADLNQNLINEFKQGGKLIFIRHAYAPGGGDPKNFDINDCKTQRNLSNSGRNQAKKIGSFFKDNNILISENVIYTGLNNEINTDNIKINLITKDVQFYMNSQNEKIKITSN